MPRNFGIFLLILGLWEISAQSSFYGRIDEFFGPEFGENIDLQFLTRLDSPRDLVEKGYHIISVMGQELHLTRDDSSVHHRGHGLAVYEGQPKDMGQGTGPSVRLLATSTGAHVGFNGHLLIGGEEFIIEPLQIGAKLLKMRRRKREACKASLPHKAYKLSSLLKLEATKAKEGHPDVARVPADELKKAREQMRNASLNSTSSDDEDSDDDEEEDVTVTSTNDDDDETGSFQLETLAKSKSKSKNKKKAAKSSLKGTKTIELAVFTDPKLFKLWEARYPKDAKAKLKAFILGVINNMQLLYQSSSLGVNIAFRLSHLELMSTNPSSLNANGGEAVAYLKSFCNYAGGKNEGGSKWDHALLLSGEDLKEKGDKLVAGMAWFSTMCLRYWSCSISEATSFGTAVVLTHEMGHSLGMEHDGTAPNTKCPDNQFIMSPTTGSGKLSWSKCSVENIQNFILSGNPEKGKSDPSAIPSCLGKISNSKAVKENFGKGQGKLPGQLFPKKIQCEYDCGSKCVPSTTTNPGEEVCSMLYCDKMISSSSKSITSAHPALEGTNCGNKKWCRFGKCVASG